MLSWRNAGAGLIAAAAVVAAVSIAPARAATGATAGQPLSLLAGLRPPHEAKAKSHGARRSIAKMARSTRTKSSRKLAALHRHRAMKPAKTLAAAKREVRRSAIATAAVVPTAATAPSPSTAPSPPPTDDNWPDANAAPAPPADLAAAPVQSVAPDADAGAVVVNGQKVQVDSPDQVNAIDLAADGDPPPAATPSGRADAAPAAQTVLAAPLHRDASTVGSASWIAQVMAALGGAIAAGAVAWFLIGSGPVRTYG